MKQLERLHDSHHGVTRGKTHVYLPGGSVSGRMRQSRSKTVHLTRFNLVVNIDLSKLLVHKYIT